MWFAAAWQLTSSKIGISAIHLQREMGLGSYQTAWADAAPLSLGVVRPGPGRLTGEVEVDESLPGWP